MSDFEEAKNFVMPFGKHKGQRLDDIPLSYLDWCAGKFDDGPVTAKIKAYLSDPSIQKMLEEEIEGR